MVKKLLTFVASTFLFSTLAFSAELSELPQMNRQMFEPSVQLFMDINDNEKGACSGVIFSSKKVQDKYVTKVLTARHCAYSFDGIKEEPLKKVVVVVKNYGSDTKIASTSTYQVTSEYSKDYDLAILTLKDSKDQFPTVKMGDESLINELQFGQTVYSVSYPQGVNKTFTEGNFENEIELPELDPDGGNISDKHFYQSSALLDHGSSGSGLFVKDKNGDYVYIGTASMMTNNFSGYYTPLENILKYLKETNNLDGTNQHNPVK